MAPGEAAHAQASRARPEPAGAGAPAIADSSTTGPPSACHARNLASASVSVIFGLAAVGYGGASPGRRPRSSRDSPPLGSSQVGAHQATTCDWARVRAT